MSSTQISLITKLSNHFKPHKAEAVQRLRTNIMCLITMLIVSYLLPIPTLPYAISSLFRTSYHPAWTAEWVREWICVLEFGLVSLFAYNILEAGYAIQYPRKPLAPIASPAKVKSPSSSFTTPQRPFKVLSPLTSPQQQKPFAYSPSASTSLGAASVSLSSLPYAQSPVSTPSRVLHYSVPPSSSTNTHASSTSDFLATPSPVISAYRGKHASMDVGRALDGLYLSKIRHDDDEED